MKLTKHWFVTCLVSCGFAMMGTANAATYSGAFLGTVPEANATGVSSTISIADASVISAISIEVFIDHPWIGDLAIYLVAPDGTSITLLDRPGLAPGVGLGFCCGSGADLESITFNDASSLIAEEIVSSFDLNPIASPTDPLSSLLGSAITGDWTLTIIDYAQGQMNTTAPSWTIAINESVVPVPVPAVGWLVALSVVALFRRQKNA